MNQKIKSVYDKYQHLDKLMTECGNAEEFTLVILSKLWSAIKDEVKNDTIEPQENIKFCLNKAKLRRLIFCATPFEVEDMVNIIVANENEIIEVKK